MQFLKQSTGATVVIGPILDASGAAVTGAVIGDLNITKNGTTAAMAANTFTHSHNGHYLLTLTTANTDTLGRLEVSANNSSHAMPVFRWTVLTAGMFDAIVTNGNVAKAGDAMALVTDAVNAAAVAASAVTEIQSGLATASQVSSLAVNTRANLQVPIEIETPDTGTQIWKIRLHLFDVEGNMEAPDSTPTVTLTNAAGTSRAARLSVASNPSTGVYTWDYTASAGDAEEQLVWLFTVIEGGLTRTYPATSYVVEETAYRFSSSDRATLNAAATAAALTALSNKIGTPAGASVAADMAAAKAVLDAVVADTNELQTDWANGGRLDLLVDAALAAAVLSRQILGNKHVVTNNGNGTYTIQIRDDGDTSTVRTIVYTPATGARTAS